MRRSNNIKNAGSIYLNKAIQNDDVYVKSSIKSLTEISGMRTRKGYDNAVVVSFDEVNPDTKEVSKVNEIVNIVSNQYGHLPNEKFFGEVEAKLMGADVNYKTRSINRNNRSFAVDYILDDERYIVTVKNSEDTIVPMLRFVTSFDSSIKTSGHFGFFRKVCNNGLHVADLEIGFSAKHTGNIIEVVMPNINTLIEKFFDNEFYTLSKEFEHLADTKIEDIREFVKNLADKTGMFKYEASDKNPEPSINSRLVIDIMEREMATLNSPANLWIGYNAFNEVLHGKMEKTFDKQKELDNALFEAVLSMAN
jgi:hypothetical protein